MTGRIDRLRQFIRQDLWVSELSTLTGIRALLRRMIRVAELVVTGFREDKLTVQASAITFASLISLVPLLAIAFSLLKGLGAGDEFLIRVHENINEMPAEFQAFIEQMLAIVHRTNFWTIGWAGVGILLLTVVQVLSSIESAFNLVWGVTSARSVWRRFTNYLSVLVLVPVLIMLGFTINASLSNAAFIDKLGEAAFLYGILLRGLPFVSTTLALFLLFTFVPNTSIHLRPALASSLVTALLWLGWQSLYVHLQVGVSRYNAIYGTFASVPIFLAWLYVSWVIILLGAQLCFALQNHATYDLERSAGNANNRSRVMLAFSITLQAGQAFMQGGSLFNAGDFARMHRVPVRLINELIRLLVRGGLLLEAAGDESCYVLRRQPEEITLKHIVDLVNQDGTGPERYGFGPDAPAVFSAMTCLDAGLAGALATTTLRQLLEQHPIPAAGS